MAMYYRSSSEIQADNTIQTLYLMNPNYLGYSDTQPQSNMLFTNSAAHALNPALVPHAPPQQFPQQQDISAAARHHYSMLAGGGNNQQTPRGLSLSLSAAVHHQEAGFDKLPVSGDCDFPAWPSNGAVNTVRSPMIMGSKYLKAAQELLDEVVNVGNHYTDKARPIKDPTTAANKEAPSANKAAAATSAALDLTTAQRQEIQMKKAKLNSLLDEVEQRCRQYHHQMQVIVAAFEQAAGPGSARSYTQLALKTILKQFRCLKSTISSQIKGLNKSLGDDEGSEVWRLRIVGRQQVGMAQNNAWRPQRGLPERAVSVLRAWLFQHFLHPYPKDLDKQMLAKETGLTRSQVSNWFINARVRLWKPMVEEMYLQETNNQPSNNIAAAATSAAIKPQPTPEISPSTSSPPGAAPTNFIASLNMENNLVEKNPKKPRNSSTNLSAAADQRLISTDNCLSMAAAANIKRYGIGELDQQLAAGFGQGNGFSLSLALPPTETFLSHRGVVEGGRINEGNYEIMGFHKFPAQLLPDYVA